MGKRIQKIKTALSAFRHGNKKQIVSEGYYNLRGLYYCTPLYPLLEDPVSAPANFVVTPPKLWRGKSSVGKKIIDAQFSHNNVTFTFEKTMKWKPAGADKTWISWLHSFQWIPDLRECGDDGRTKALELIEDWLQNYNHYSQNIWSGLAISHRIMMWLTHYDWLAEGMSAQQKIDFRLSLARQVDHLSRNLHWHMGGHILVSDLKALVYAGLCIPSHQTAYLDAISLLQDELKKQVMHDGFHTSRTPSTHFAVLKELVDIQAMVRKAGQTPPAYLTEMIDRMAAAHQFFLHGDKKLAQFNTSEEGDANFMDKVIQRCDAQQLFKNHLPNSGFVRLEGNKTCLFVDAGKPNTKTLHAYQHAQISTFELSHAKERIIVNCGGFGFASPRALAYRQAPAHNTISINGESPVEILTKGRIGKAPQTVDVKVTHDTQQGSGVTISHDSFKHINKTQAERTLFLATNGDLIGEDAFTATGPIKAQLYMNLHPDVDCSLISDAEALLTLKSGKKFRFLVKGATMHESESTYTPDFGEEIASKRLVLRANSRHNSCTVTWAVKAVPTASAKD